METQSLVSAPKMGHPEFTINIPENPTSITQVTSPRLKKIENALATEATDSDSTPIEVKVRTRTESDTTVVEYNPEEIKNKYVSFEPKKKNHMCLNRTNTYLLCIMTIVTIIVLIIKVVVSV